MNSGDGPAGWVGGVLEGGVPGDGSGAGASDRLAVGHRLRGRRRREEVGENVPVISLLSRTNTVFNTITAYNIFN